MTDDSTIRTWARRNGYQVGERGRLQENVKEAYYREYPNQRPIHIAPLGYCLECNRELPNHYSSCPTLNPNGTCSECYQPTTSHRDWCSLATKVEPIVTTTYVESIPDESTTPVPAPPVNAEKADTPAPALSDATAQFAAAIAALTAGQAQPLDENRVREIAEEVAITAVAELSTPKVYAIHIPEMPVKEIGGSLHHKFADLVKIVGAGIHAYLVGTPGTGKTTLCEQVADALGLEFSFVACGPQMSETKLLGYMDANGNYRRTEFRDRIEHGGLFLFGEIDNAYPGVVTVMNMALSNGWMSFPDGKVKVNENFRCVADANTFGTGATRQFVGRNQLDAATLDRFVAVVIDIDEELESAIAVWPENVDAAKGWIGKVREWRSNASASNLSVLITPRASIFGVKLLRAGFAESEVAEMCIWKGMDATTRSKIERGF